MRCHGRVGGLCGWPCVLRAATVGSARVAGAQVAHVFALRFACVLQVLLTFQVLTHIIEEAGVTDIQALQMQQNITTFEDILGGCERLLRTPIPVSYTRHTSRFLLIWLTCLPLALYGKLGWTSVPAVGFIALLLLGAPY